MCEGGGSGGEEVCRGQRVLFLRSPEGVGSGGMSTTEEDLSNGGRGGVWSTGGVRPRMILFGVGGCAVEPRERMIVNGFIKRRSIWDARHPLT